MDILQSGASDLMFSEAYLKGYEILPNSLYGNLKISVTFNSFCELNLLLLCINVTHSVKACLCVCVCLLSHSPLFLSVVWVRKAGEVYLIDFIVMLSILF